MKTELFTSRQLREMIVPLFLEQLLVLLVGLADTLLVSYVGESAVSGVSLVNSFNTIFIYLFTALATGGAVIASQYLGHKDRNAASEAISQLLMFSTLFSVVMMALVLAFHKPMLRFLFGKVEQDVMDACVTYLWISACSYPAIAVYNVGAALARSVGKTDLTMKLSILSNLINIVGNMTGVFVLKAGVAGVAWPSLIARMFSAFFITIVCFTDRYEIRYQKERILHWNGKMLQRILRIAIPNGIESGIFQLIKVALSSVVALFGTYQIAANGIAQTIWSLAALSSITMEPVFITVIGQCMGAGDTEQAEYEFIKLLKITFALSIVWNILIFALTPVICRFYAVSSETKTLVVWLVLIHNSFSIMVHPIGYPFAKGLRAAGDVTFTTVIGIVTSVIRLLLSVVFSIVWDMGVVGIALAMVLDWVIRAVFFFARFRSGKWREFRVI